MEQLTIDGFAVKNEVDSSGLPYEEFRVFLMHTMWLTESNSLTRWFEWFMAVRTYTVITTDPTNTPQASVTATEITAPACDDCIMSVTHSGILQFYEERDINQPNFPLNKPMVYLDDCNWDVVRNDLAFQSLTGGICMAVALKDKSSLRKFKLEKLSFGYLGQDGVKRAIDHKYLYDETGKKPVVSNVMDYVRWDNNATRRHLQIRLKILVLGQVSRLQYSVQLRLCELEDPYVQGQCIILTAGKAGNDATDLKFNRLRQRMLEGHEPSRRRYLADKDKNVVQQYMSESTYVGDSKGLAKPTKKEETGGNAGAVVGGVVVLGAIGTVGYLYWAKKGCFAAKDAAQGVPSQPAQAQGTGV